MSNAGDSLTRGCPHITLSKKLKISTPSPLLSSIIKGTNPPSLPRKRYQGLLVHTYSEMEQKGFDFSKKLRMQLIFCKIERIFCSYLQKMNDFLRLVKIV